MRRKAGIALVCAVMVFLTGCWDSREIDDQLFVLVMGIDKEENGLRLSIHVPVSPKASERSQASSGSGDKESSGGQGEEKSGENEAVVSVTGRDFIEAMDLLTATTPYHVNMQQLKVLAVSEEFARSDMFHEFLSAVIFYRSIRRTATIAVMRGSAREFVGNLHTFEGPLTQGKALEVAMDAYNDNSYVPRTTLQTLKTQMSSFYGDGIAMYGTVSKASVGEEGTKKFDAQRQPGDLDISELPTSKYTGTRIFGSALFNHKKMVGSLTGYETQLTLLMRGQAQGLLIRLPYNDDDEHTPEYVSVQVGAIRKPRNRVSIDETRALHISVNLPLRASLLTWSEQHPPDTTLLTNELTEVITQDISELCARLQKQNTDPVGFRGLLARQFGTMQEMINYEWERAYESAQTDVHVEVYFSVPFQEKLDAAGIYD